MPGRNGCVGNQGSRARRPVYERKPFLLTQIARLDQRPEEMAESQDLTRASIPLSRYDGKRSATVQERRNRLDETSTGGGMPAQKVREAGEHDAAHNSRRQRLAERSRPESRSTRLASTLGVVEPLTGAIAVSARHPVHRDVRPGNQAKERLPRRIRRLESGHVDPNGLAAPRNSLEHFERDLGTRAKHDHPSNLYRPASARERFCEHCLR